MDHPECKLMARRDRHYVDVVECPPTANYGNTYVCGAIQGRVSGTWNGENHSSFESIREVGPQGMSCLFSMQAKHECRG